jgi:thiamine-phosphate pyrophosphorylase
MHRRQPIPRLWLMTDERQGEALWAALRRLPRGSGVVFRHYSLPRGDRRALFEKVRAEARRRGLILLVAGRDPLRGDGKHNRRGVQGLRSASAHDLPSLKHAEREGAKLVFLSPVFPTRSHPGARAIGVLRFGRIARQAKVPLIALGGMDARRGRRMFALGAYGWAGIDAFGAQKRKAVPT